MQQGSGRHQPQLSQTDRELLSGLSSSGRASRARVVSAQHGNLVTQHQDLYILGCLGTCEQRQPAQHAGECQVRESEGHNGIMLGRLPTVSVGSVD